MNKKNLNITEASKLEKLFRKIGWAGEDRSPVELKKQVRELSDETLKIWYEDSVGIKHTPANFQDKLVKAEMIRRGLIDPKDLKD